MTDKTTTLPEGHFTIPMKPMHANTIAFHTTGPHRDVLCYRPEEGWTVPEGVPVDEAAQHVFTTLREMWTVVMHFDAAEIENDRLREQLRVARDALVEIYDHDDGAWAAGKHHRIAERQGRTAVRAIARAALAQLAEPTEVDHG